MMNEFNPMTVEGQQKLAELLRPSEQAKDVTHYFELVIRDEEDWIDSQTVNTITLTGITEKLLPPLVELFWESNLYVTIYYKGTEN